MKKETQKDRVRKILLANGKIDNYYCIENKLTIRLGAIMCALKEEGFKFTSNYIEGTKNCVYTLVDTPKVEVKRLIVVPTGDNSVRLVEKIEIKEVYER